MGREDQDYKQGLNPCIRDVPPGRRAHMEDLLSRAVSPNAVARIAREEWGLWRGLALCTVVKMLARHRDRFVPLLESAKFVDPKSASTLRNRAIRSVDLLEEYAQALSINNARLDMMVDAETRSGHVSSETNEVMALHVQLLRNIGDLSVRAGVSRELLRQTDDSRRRGHYIPPELVGAISTVMAREREDRD